MDMQRVSDTLMLVGVVNGRRDRKSRIFLDQRLALFTSWFKNLSPESSFKVKVESADAGILLFEEARQLVFQDDLQVLHLSGFLGEEDHLIFTDDPLDEGLDPVELGKWLRRFPNLKLVFLDGCASHALVTQILRCDIPAVVAIPLLGPKDYPGKESAVFYRTLIARNTLEQCFNQTIAQFRRSFSMHLVDYDLESDSLTWESKSNVSDIEAGVYLLSDRQEVLTWSPVAGTIEKKIKQSGAGLSLSLTSIGRRSRLWGSGLIVAALASLLFFVAGGPGMYRGLADRFTAWQNDCTFASTSDENMIWMGAFDEKGKLLTNVSDACWKEMEPEIVREPATSAISHTQITLPAAPFIAEKLEACQAQWVLYAQSQPWKGDTLNWTYTAVGVSADPLVFNWHSKQIQGSYFFHWILGKVWADRGKNVAAIEQLLKIPVVNSADYGPVAALLAELYSRQETPAYALAYANLAIDQGVKDPQMRLLRARLNTLNGIFASALDDYQMALDQDSTLEEAWFQRGLLLLSLKEIADARFSAETLLRQYPDSGRGFGLLAAAAAAAGDSLVVYRSVEMAYEKGFDPATLEVLQASLLPFSHSPLYPRPPKSTGN